MFHKKIIYMFSLTSNKLYKIFHCEKTDNAEFFNMLFIRYVGMLKIENSIHEGEIEKNTAKKLFAIIFVFHVKSYTFSFISV